MFIYEYYFLVMFIIYYVYLKNPSFLEKNIKKQKDPPVKCQRDSNFLAPLIG